MNETEEHIYLVRGEGSHVGKVQARSVYSLSVVVTCSCGNWVSPRYESEGDALDAFETHRYQSEVSPRDPRIAAMTDGIGRGNDDDAAARYLDTDDEVPNVWDAE